MNSIYFIRWKQWNAQIESQDFVEYSTLKIAGNAIKAWLAVVEEAKESSTNQELISIVRIEEHQEVSKESKK